MPSDHQHLQNEVAGEEPSSESPSFVIDVGAFLGHRAAPRRATAWLGMSDSNSRMSIQDSCLLHGCIAKAMILQLEGAPDVLRWTRFGIGDRPAKGRKLGVRKCYLYAASAFHVARDRR